MEAPMAYQMGILIPSRLETVISIFRIGSSFFCGRCIPRPRCRKADWESRFVFFWVVTPIESIVTRLHASAIVLATGAGLKQVREMSQCQVKLGAVLRPQLLHIFSCFQGSDRFVTSLIFSGSLRARRLLEWA